MFLLNKYSRNILDNLLSSPLSIDSFDSFNYYPCDKQVLQPGTRLFSRKQYCSQNGQNVNILIYNP